MTSSTKPEAHNISWRANRQTDRQTETDMLITIFRTTSGGEVAIYSFMLTAVGLIKKSSGRQGGRQMIVTDTSSSRQHTSLMCADQSAAAGSQSLLQTLFPQWNQHQIALIITLTLLILTQKELENNIGCRMDSNQKHKSRTETLYSLR